MSLFWVQPVIDQWLKWTLCASYFTDFILGLIGNWPVIKADTLC